MCTADVKYKKYTQNLDVYNFWKVSFGSSRKRWENGSKMELTQDHVQWYTLVLVVRLL
jgi:hypothetical protein